MGPHPFPVFGQRAPALALQHDQFKEQRSVLASASEHGSATPPFSHAAPAAAARTWRPTVDRAIALVEQPQLRVGNAANLAAKLTALSADQPTWITKRVHDRLKENQKVGSNGEDIWQSWKWSQHNEDPIFSTTYWRMIA